MEKVVYLLGAGFSAPLGLPVMSNFLEKSKDQYFMDRDKYEYFDDVFRTIREKLSNIKNYYTTDLFNIEDILSILEMRDSAGDGTERSQFNEYIKAVIEHYTPTIEPFTFNDKNWVPLQDWATALFGSFSHWRSYGMFVCSILGHAFDLGQVFSHSDPFIPYAPLDFPNKKVEYSVVTLNYDCILERIADQLNYFGGERHFVQDMFVSQFKGAFLAKLHGSVDSGVIIPPTWNKSMSRHKEIEFAWRLAYKLLSEANHIRILGYSLPITDSYVKYLLRAAVIDSPHLKSIDVLCLDPDGTVRKRYDEFVLFKNYQFRSESILGYLDTIREKRPPSNDRLLMFDGLEEAHRAFFRSP